MEKIVHDFRTYLLNESKEESGGIRLFCDMDGVLTDFDRGFKRLKANEDHLKPKEYEKKHGKNSIWPLIDHRGIKFWKRLPWKSDGRELWDYIHRYSPVILSAPSRSPDSVKGKLYWLKLNLGINEKHPARKFEEWDGTQKVILTADKGAFAESKNDILIDDRRPNIDKWTEAGGTGILHNDSTDTVRILEGIISKLKGEPDDDKEPAEKIEPKNTEQNEQPEDTQNQDQGA
jgi:hypothetical protein